ncbi:MAG: tRNA pseudouridine(55) synthase TruB [Acidimicrobiales bacterium]
MTKKRDEGPSGFVVVDKETEWTSHDVVAKARGVFNTRKIGHSGTLDPGATGVLVLGVGRGTRLLRFVTALEKTYVAEAVLGVETDSLDADGEVTVRHDMSGVTIDDVRRVATRFVGDIEQIPPMVSAIKIDGKRLHELAREGKTVERKPRPVTVHELTIDPTFVETPQGEPDVFRFTTRCGSGTYIRTIAADIGAALGGGAHLRYLRRTAIGRHTEAHASTLENATIISLAEGLADYQSVTLDDDTIARVRNGQRLSEEILTGAGPWVLLDQQGVVVAMHERVDGGQIKPAVVIPAPEI